MSPSRRDVIAVLAAGAASVLAAPLRAAADRVRILPSPGGSDPVPGPSAAAPDEIRHFLDDLSAGGGREHGALRIFWLHGTVARPLAIATLEEARANADLVIGEQARAAVPELVVENRGKGHVLLLAGEILVGGKQNRIVREDVLLPPLSGPRAIGVYCVEQGRWDAGRGGFDAPGTLAAPKLRAKVMERAGQGEVWAQVQRYSAQAAAPSPTASYQAVHDKPEVKDHARAVEQAIGRPAVRALGAAVFMGPDLAGIDAFHDPGLFARLWPKLLHAHAIDAYRRPPAPALGEKEQRARVGEALEAAAHARGTLRASAGVGRLFEFGLDRARGAALAYEQRVVHLAIV